MSMNGPSRLGETLDCVPQDATVVLLSHNPDIIASRGLTESTWCLLAHTHGGQLVLPLGGRAHAVCISQTEKTLGYFWHGRTQFYITRGWVSVSHCGTMPSRRSRCLRNKA